MWTRIFRGPTRPWAYTSPTPSLLPTTTTPEKTPLLSPDSKLSTRESASPSSPAPMPSLRATTPSTRGRLMLSLRIFHLALALASLCVAAYLLTILQVQQRGALAVGLAALASTALCDAEIIGLVVPAAHGVRRVPLPWLAWGDGACGVLYVVAGFCTVVGGLGEGSGGEGEWVGILWGFGAGSGVMHGVNLVVAACDVWSHPAYREHRRLVRGDEVEEM